VKVDEATNAQRLKREVPLLVVLHGANLNLLGERPAEHYGTLTLPELEELIRREAEDKGFRCRFHQTNHEGEFIELLHASRSAAAVIVNPGAWTHYSYAIRDALELVGGRVAEVHLSGIEHREHWRARSVIREVVDLSVSGEGPEGYLRAIRELDLLVREGSM